MSFVHSSSQIRYDLAQPDTWANLPSPASIVWCFPAIPQDLASAFGQVMTNKGCRFLLLGSTSAYPSKADVLTDEGDELSMAVPRAQSEEHVRKTYGAIILRLAGLHHTDQDAMCWIGYEEARSKSADRYPSMLEDAAALCLTALHQADPGSSYLVSDGMPRRAQSGRTSADLLMPDGTSPSLSQRDQRILGNVCPPKKSYVNSIIR